MSAADARIHKLDEAVVNRIAAGEVIVRPSSAIKEIVENSLDAGATQITVTIGNGGIKLIQVQDNGHGIRHDDLPILCERFTTSKLSKFEDLRRIGTFGFRGEALASITHVARLSITTCREGAACAYRAHYEDGHLVPPPGERDGGVADPRPCAGVTGTQVAVEDLFYNMVARRRALRSTGEEYRRIVDVIGRYAVRYAATCGFACRKLGASTAEVHTTAGCGSRAAVRSVYGPACAKELVPLTLVAGGAPSGASSASSSQLRWPEGMDHERRTAGESYAATGTGLVSNANYSLRRGVYIFFVNGRLVECSPLRKSVDAVYADLLPKGSHPFVYLDINMPPEHVDVNVHPTKQEVRFLDEDGVARRVQAALTAALQGANASRAYAVQAILPPDFTSQPARSTPPAPPPPPAARASPAAAAVTVSQPQSQPPQKKIRREIQAGDMDRFVHRGAVSGSDGDRHSHSDASRSQSPFETPSSSALTQSIPDSVTASLDDDADADADDDADDVDKGKAEMGDVDDVSEGEKEPAAARLAREGGGSAGPTRLTSVRRLVSAALAAEDAALRTLLSGCDLIGCIGRRRALVQRGTELILVDLHVVCTELFRQLMLQRFASARPVRLAPAPALPELCNLALRTATGGEHDAEAGAAAARAVVERRRMLWDYFAMDIGEEDGTLRSLPLLLPGLSPPAHALPAFALRMGTEVDYSSETECFAGIASALGALYAAACTEQAEAWDAAHGEPAPDPAAAWRDTVRHVLLPALAAHFAPPGRLATSGAVVRVADTEALYRVFERC